MKKKLLWTQSAAGWLAMTMCAVCVARGQNPAPPIDLKTALAMAHKNDAVYQAAVTQAALAHEDKRQARAALLPTLTFLNAYLYTQPNSTGFIFIANNAVNEYVTQGSVHESLSFSSGGAYKQTVALEAAAKARQEIAQRGLDAAVTEAYYALLTAQHKAVSAERSLGEARQFVELTRKQESGGEAAHADVIKAELTEAQRERDLSNARLMAEKAKIALSIFLFPDYGHEYEVVDDLDQAPRLAAFDEVSAMAGRNNPDIRAAEAALKAEKYGVSAARGGYLPSLNVDYFYGIDAPNFAVTGPLGQNNLGSSVLASISLPLWNWKATASRVEQAKLREAQARRELSLTQRQLLGSLDAYYKEAQTAYSQVDSLKHSLDLATESLRLTVLRYEGGEATALEVTDAQGTLATARDAYADGLNRYQVALAVLRTLTGG